MLAVYRQGEDRHLLKMMMSRWCSFEGHPDVKHAHHDKREMDDQSL